MSDCHHDQLEPEVVLYHPMRNQQICHGFTPHNYDVNDSTLHSQATAGTFFTYYSKRGLMHCNEKFSH